MHSYTYRKLTPPNITHHGLHTYRPGLREGVSQMLEIDGAQMRVPTNFEDEVAEESSTSGIMIAIDGLKKIVTPLIRVIVLEPGSGPLLRCRLEHCDLREDVQFEALSYVWGDPKDTKEIICSGCQFFVTRNLYDALKVLCYPDKERYLWVDALCINQMDNSEVTDQVNMMGYIYSCAQRVLVWLGVEQKEDSTAIEAIQETIKFMKGKRDESSLQSAMEKLFNNPDLPVNAWQHVGNLFSRPYFKRLWVIQEVVNSASAIVHYGDRTPIEWNDIVIMSKLLGNSLVNYFSPGMEQSFHLKSLEESNVSIISDLLHSRQNNMAGRPFFDILFHTHKFRASYPRDNIFSILNLPRYRGEWIPLANSELSDFEVFRDLAILDLMRNKSVKILSWVNTAGVDRPPENTLPSWVPSTDDFEGPAPSFFMECGRKSSMDNNEKVVAWINDDKTLLKLNGRLLPTPIKYISGSRSIYYLESEAKYPIQPTDFTDSVINIERRWFVECFNIFLKAKIEPLLDLENHTPTTTDSDRETSPPPEVPLVLHELTTRRSYQRFLITMCRNWNPFLGTIASAADIENVRVMTEVLVASYSLDQFFETEKSQFLEVYRTFICQEHTKWKKIAALTDGRVGWVPKNAQEGDRICIFSGGRESFLLRPVVGEEGSNECYKLLGECYFEGLENGSVGLEGMVNISSIVIC